MTKRNRKNQEEQKDAALQAEQHVATEQTKTPEPTEPTSKEDESQKPTKEQTKAAESNAEKADEKTAVKQSSDQKETPAPNAVDKASQASTPATWPGKLGLAISLLALALSAYLFNQARQNNSAQTTALKSISTLETSLAEAVAKTDKTAASVSSTVNSTVSGVEGKLAALQQATADKEKAIDELQQRLTKSIQQVEASTQQRNSRKDWLLAEVEYLLRLANQRVLMENSPVGALALLKSADKILVQSDDVALFSVRKALAADIAALEAVPKIDQEGIYLKLDAMSAQIDQLKLVPITDKKQLPGVLNDVANDAAEQGTLAKVWDKASAKLEKLVVISHRSEAIEPLLTPAQQAGLLQNLHILFEQAQLSLLQQKPQAFARSLAKAQKIISTYFQAKDGTSVALLAGLSSLEGTQIRAVMPSIAGSLNTLKGHMTQASDIRAGAE